VTTQSTIASFGGKLLKLAHTSSTLGCESKFNLFLPQQAQNGKVPLLIYLSGLTCTGDNCSEKGFFQHGASKRGIAVLYPDTSPRKSPEDFLKTLFWHGAGGIGIKGEDDAYDFGTGAGFYVDATAEPWSKNYKMYSYITEELPKTISEAFKDQIDMSKVSITGHSMGGHGALSLYLKNPGKYKSVSAFAPISNPLKAPWGEKAFKGYFGEQDWQKKGAEHDSTELLKQWKGGPLDILIDVVCITLSAVSVSIANRRRGPAMISTKRDSSSRKTSSQPQRRSDRRKASMSDSNPITTTATTPWLPSRTITSTMLQSICLHSMSLILPFDGG
jgi:S-formylglutathione hydrolase